MEERCNEHNDHTANNLGHHCLITYSTAAICCDVCCYGVLLSCLLCYMFLLEIILEKDNSVLLKLSTSALCANG